MRRDNANVTKCMLMSIALHLLIAAGLSIFIRNQEQMRIKEAVNVEMVKAKEDRMPTFKPRSVPIRASSFDPKLLRQMSPQIQLASPKVSLSRTMVSEKFTITRDVIPQFGTTATQLRTDRDIKFPKGGFGPLEISRPTEGRGKPGGQSSGSNIEPIGAGNIFEVAMLQMAKNIISKNKTGREDVVLLIDASGSMEENIRAVASYLIRMIEVFTEHKIDYMISIIKYNRLLKENKITVYEQLTDIKQIRTILRSIRCEGDESTFDAIEEALYKLKYREPSDKTFIIVTDEPFKPKVLGRLGSRNELLRSDFNDILNKCLQKGVKVNVLGSDDEMQKTIARETGGLWFQIPRVEEMTRY